LPGLAGARYTAVTHGAPLWPEVKQAAVVRCAAYSRRRTTMQKKTSKTGRPKRAKRIGDLPARTAEASKVKGGYSLNAHVAIVKRQEGRAV
jgi:hypothetical protein